MDPILQAIHESLFAINNPRFFETERGFQGELSSGLRNRLPAFEFEGAIIEQEYQKRLKDHGFKIRPDIIIHIPFEGSGFSKRDEGNFVVIELKHKATKNEAVEDYNKLSRMCEVLKYPLGVFVNIQSDKTYFENFEGKYKDRLSGFAVMFDGTENKVIRD